MLHEFLKGFCLALSFIIASVIVIMSLVAISKKGKKQNTKKMLIAFKKYKQRMINKDRFDDLPEVDKIIHELKDGTIPKELSGFLITSNSHIKVTEKGKSSGVSIVKTYKVKRKNN